MKPVKYYDELYGRGHYTVKVSQGRGMRAKVVYDNLTGTDAEYYKIYCKPVKKVLQRPDSSFILYIEDDM